MIKFIKKTGSSEINFEKTKAAIIDPGEIFAIIGKAGSGKTSLLRSAAGIGPGKYDVIIKDKEISKLDRKTIARIISHNLGIKMQNKDEKLRDFLMLSRLPFKKQLNPYSDYDHDICDKYAAQLELTDHMNSPLSKISASTRRIALVCFALIREPEFLILDEPSARQDIRSVSLLARTLIKFAATVPSTILIASNDINFILQTADRVALIENNTIAEILKPYEIDSEFIMKYFQTETLTSRNIYNGRPMVHYYTEN